MNFSYLNVTLVAHSLGAVVSRQAVLNAHLRKKSWTSRVGLVLFGPAHQGANIIALFSDAITGMRLRFFTMVKFFLKYRFRVLQDLEPGCNTLKKLLEDTDLAISGAGAQCLVARVVVHSDADDVVEPIRFAQDPPHELIHRKTHRQVCKPRLYFMEPVKWVLGA
jgi:hypothetical protein